MSLLQSLSLLHNNAHTIQAHTHTHSLSLSLSLTITYTHIHTHTHAHTHKHTSTLSLSLPLTHTHTYTQQSHNTHISHPHSVSTRCKFPTAHSKPFHQRPASTRRNSHLQVLLILIFHRYIYVFPCMYSRCVTPTTPIVFI